MKSQLQSTDGGSGAVQSTTVPNGPGARSTLIGSRLVEGRSAASVDNQLQMCHRLIHLWKSVEDLEHGQAVSSVLCVPRDVCCLPFFFHFSISSVVRRPLSVGCRPLSVAR